MRSNKLNFAEVPYMEFDLLVIQDNSGCGVVYFYEFLLFT